VFTDPFCVEEPILYVASTLSHGGPALTLSDAVFVFETVVLKAAENVLCNATAKEILCVLAMDEQFTNSWVSAVI
jgi:hypothetical protein